MSAEMQLVRTGDRVLRKRRVIVECTSAKSPDAIGKHETQEDIVNGPTPAELPVVRRGALLLLPIQCSVQTTSANTPIAGPRARSLAATVSGMLARDASAKGFDGTTTRTDYARSITSDS